MLTYLPAVSTCMSEALHVVIRLIYYYSPALVVMGVAMVIVYAHGSLVAQKTGMIARIICTSAVYERVCPLLYFTTFFFTTFFNGAGAPK